MDVSPTTADEISDEELEEVATTTAKGRQQSFRQKWVETNSWLQCKNGRGYCKYCDKSISNNIIHIKRHGKSAFHQKRTDCLKNQPQACSQDNAAAFKKLNTKVKTAELRIILFILQFNLPFLLADHLVNLIKVCGKDSKVVEQIGFGRTKATSVTNTIVFEEGLAVISRTLRENKFSIIIDETTDISTTKCLAMVVRYFEKNLGRVVDKFFRLIELTDFYAKSIYDKIKLFFDTHHIPLENLIGFASDNASVMMGQNRGVRNFFEKNNPHLCYGLYLPFSPLMFICCCEKVDKQCRNIGTKYIHIFLSQFKKTNKIQRTKEFFNVKPHKILKTSSTRWLSLQKVVNGILEQWIPLKEHFRQCQDDNNMDLAKTIYSELNITN